MSKRPCYERKNYFNQPCEDVTPDILTPGHVVNIEDYLQQDVVTMINVKKEKILERANLSKYPTKFTFDKVVRIYAYMFKFLESFDVMKWRLEKRIKNKLKFKMFVVQEIKQNGYLSVPLSFHYQPTVNVISMPADGSGSELQFKGNFKIPLDDEYINEALNFLFLHFLLN